MWNLVTHLPGNFRICVALACHYGPCQWHGVGLVNNRSCVSSKFKGSIEIGQIIYELSHACCNFHVEWSREMRDKTSELLLSFSIATRSAVPRDLDFYQRIFGVFLVRQYVTRFTFVFRFTDRFILWRRILSAIRSSFSSSFGGAWNRTSRRTSGRSALHDEWSSGWLLKQSSWM